MSRKVRTDDLTGRYVIKKKSFLRRLMSDSLDAVPSGHNMMGLLEFDITEPRKILRTLKRNGHRVSFFAFVVKSIATAIGEYGELNAVSSKKKIFEFEDIDINIPVELDDENEKFPRQVVIRKANDKTVEEIYREIEESKKKHEAEGETGKEDRWAMRLMGVLFILPKFIKNFILRWITNKPLTVKKNSGTVFVTSVNMVVPGYAIPYLGGPRAVSFALGGIGKKPAVVGRDVVIREFLDMTVIFNHDVVDGAPAARFITRLKTIIEKAIVLQEKP